MSSETIDRFRGQYAFLSNFHQERGTDIRLDGEVYPSVEHAFQAAKTLDRNGRFRIRMALTPSEAKRRGRSVVLRADWEEVKVEVMYGLLRQKFRHGTPLAKLLLDTGDALLVEGNDWGDYFWGVCNGRGWNHLGKLLMRVREELRERAGAEAFSKELTKTEDIAKQNREAAKLFAAVYAGDRYR
jgi:ribA/ribD-fused uncharacterized protein